MLTLCITVFVSHFRIVSQLVLMKSLDKPLNYYFGPVIILQKNGKMSAGGYLLSLN